MVSWQAFVVVDHNRWKIYPKSYAQGFAWSFPWYKFCSMLGNKSHMEPRIYLGLVGFTPKQAIKLVLVRLDQIYIGLLIFQFYVAYSKKKHVPSFGIVGFFGIYMSSMEAALHLISISSRRFNRYIATVLDRFASGKYN